MQETNFMTDLFSALIKMGYQTNEYWWAVMGRSLATEIFIIFISNPSRETFSITYF